MSCLLADSWVYAHGDPHAIWDELRRVDPVHWVDADGYSPFWAITKYHDIRTVLQSPKVFCSHPQNIVRHERVRNYEASIGGKAGDFAGTVVGSDGAQHRKLRNPLNSIMKRSAVDRWRPRILEITSNKFDQIMARGLESEIDFASEVALPIPLATFCEFLGLSNHEKWLDLVSTMLQGFSPTSTAPMSLMEQEVEAGIELRALCFREVMARKMLPRDDVLTDLVLSLDSVVDAAGILSFMAIAGFWNVSTVISHGLVILMENRDYWERLRRDSSLIPNAVEELLRMVSPTIHMVRTATEDFELRGRTIRRGDKLALFFPSANRDEEVFDEPHTFRLDRVPNNHLAFGHGPHVCPGSYLTRVQLEIVFRELTQRVTTVDRVGPIERLEGNILAGILRFPVRFQFDASAVKNQGVRPKKYREAVN